MSDVQKGSEVPEEESKKNVQNENAQDAKGILNEDDLIITKNERSPEVAFEIQTGNSEETDNEKKTHR